MTATAYRIATQYLRRKAFSRGFLSLLLVSIAIAPGRDCRAETPAEIPIEAAVYHVHRPGGIHKTYLDVVVGQAFTGELPNDIDSITVTGPDGKLRIGKKDFRYNPQWRAFWIVLPGFPVVGRYSFELSGKNLTGFASDTQSRIRTIPVPDASGLTPAGGARETCPTTVFSWPLIDAAGPLYYQLQIRDAERRHVYRSDYVLDADSFRLPPEILPAGKQYQWRVRVADGPDWKSLNNRSHSKWVTISKDDAPDPCDYPYRVPVEIDDGWPTASLAETGIDAARIDALRQRLLNGDLPNIHSLLIVKNGLLVLEEYLYGNSRKHPHHLMSVTKSITSILIGLAMKRNLIAGTDLPMIDFFPAYPQAAETDGMRDIRLHHVLTMTAGLDWNTWIYPDGDPRDSSSAMARSDDWIGHVLARDIVAPPGQLYIYSNGLSMLLGEILRNAAGQPANRYAERHLFEPLGISDFGWRLLADGRVDTAGGLYLRSRDMAKIGQMMLEDGKWKGREILSRDWVRRSTAIRVNQPLLLGSGYGYHWWRGHSAHGDRIIELFFAAGKGGQYIFVCPELDLVVVFTSETFDNPMGEFRPQIVMVKSIIPALLPAPAPRGVVSLDAESLQSLSGDYKARLTQMPVTIFSRDGNLYYESKGEEIGRLTALSPTRFAGESKLLGPILAQFHTDKSGKATHFTAQIGFGFWHFDKTR